MIVSRIKRTIWLWKCDVEWCGHEWQSKDGKKPKRCGKCKSPYWDKK